MLDPSNSTTANYYFSTNEVVPQTFKIQVIIQIVWKMLLIIKISPSVLKLTNKNEQKMCQLLKLLLR